MRKALVVPAASEVALVSSIKPTTASRAVSLVQVSQRLAKPGTAAAVISGRGDTAGQQQRRHTHGARRLDLARGDGLDGTAQNLGGIGTLHDAKDGDASGDAGQLDGVVAVRAKEFVHGVGDGEIQDQDQHQFGHGAHEGGVDAQQIACDRAAVEFAERAKHADQQAKAVSAKGDQDGVPQASK